MNIKRKLITTSVISFVLFALVIIICWFGYRSMASSKIHVRSLKEESMYLEMLFRGINETLLTEGTPYSVKIARTGMERFEELHWSLVTEPRDYELRRAVLERIAPRWHRIKKGVEPFLKVNSVSQGDPALMMNYGKLLNEGGLLIKEVQALSEEVIEKSNDEAKKTQVLIVAAVFLILAAMASLHLDLYRSIAVPIRKLKELMSEVSDNKGDLTRDGRSVSRISERLTPVERRLVSRITDISALVSAFDSMASSVNTHMEEQKWVEKKLKRLATVDDLTQAYNRLMFEEIIEKELERARRHGSHLSIIIFDLDRFKSVNDSYGHFMGDHVLRTVAAIVRANIRSIDYLVRWGGEEFMIIAPESTLDKAALMAERLRQKIEEHRFEMMGNVTSSFGVAEYRQGDDKDSLIVRSDNAMYRAKAVRNRVESAA